METQNAAEKKAALRDSMRKALASKKAGVAAKASAAPVNAHIPQNRDAGYPAHARGSDAVVLQPPQASSFLDSLDDDVPETSPAQNLAKMPTPSQPSKPSQPGQERRSQETCEVSWPEPDVDPWPEIALGNHFLGVEDGAKRALELQRRGDFVDSARMWSKVLHVARRCRPALTDAKIAELSLNEALAVLRLDDWAEALRVCQRTMQLVAVAERPEAETSAHGLQLVASVIVQAHCARARARAEVGDADGAREDMAAGLARSVPDGEGPGGRAAVQEEAEDLETRLQEIAKLPVSRPEAIVKKVVELDTNGDPIIKTNQAFFDSMEEKWEAECSADGWNEVLRNNAALKSPSSADLVNTVITPTDGENHIVGDSSYIPADSDYFRVRLPTGRDRELRAGVDAVMAAAQSAPPLPPLQRPRRNLDELRRVEEATREAIEQEQTRRKETTSEPIRCRSDVVFLDTLSLDSHSESESLEESEGQTDVTDGSNSGGVQTGEDQERTAANAEATFRAFEEFSRLGQEKEERLAKWRARYC